MNPENIVWMKIILAALVILFTTVVVLAKNNRIFCFLPSNHYACAIMPGGQFHHILVHKRDRLKVINRLEEKINNLPSGDPERIALEKALAKFLLDVESCRGPLVALFNICLISLNPFVTLKGIKVVKKYLIEGRGEKINDHYSEKSESELFLRVVFPRVELLESVELADNSQIDFIAFCGDIMIIDPERVFITYNGDVSIAVDSPFNSAMINYFSTFTHADGTVGPMTFDEFQATSFSADPSNPFNKALLDGKSFYANGLFPNGPFSISYYELAGSMTELRAALQQKVVATAKAAATITTATADANATTLRGNAEAEVIAKKEAAKVAGAGALADIAVSIPNAEQRDAYVRTAVAASIGSATAPLSLGGNGLGILVTEKEKPTIETP